MAIQKICDLFLQHTNVCKALHSALAFTDSRVNKWFTDLYLFSFGGEDHGDVIFTKTGVSRGAGGRIASAPFFMLLVYCARK
jgi:hypothetical protein